MIWSPEIEKKVVRGFLFIYLHYLTLVYKINENNSTNK